MSKNGISMYDDFEKVKANVNEKIYDDFAKKFAKRSASLKVADGR